MTNLSPELKSLLLKVHARHIATMGQSEKEKHSLDKIKKVKVNGSKNCLEVYYEHDWYHYTKNGTWY